MLATRGNERQHGPRRESERDAHAVDGVALAEKELCQVRAILAGNTCFGRPSALCSNRRRVDAFVLEPSSSLLDLVKAARAVQRGRKN